MALLKRTDVRVWLLGLPLYFSVSLLVTQKRNSAKALALASHAHPLRNLTMQPSLFQQRAVNGTYNPNWKMDYATVFWGTLPILILILVGVIALAIPAKERVPA